MQITGIILAGGKSKRMGTDKALLKLDGNTLLDKAIDLCKSVCNQVIISSNNPEHKRMGYQVIPDEIEECGPIGGIYSCLKKSETIWNFVLSVDAAFVEPEFLSYLILETGDFNAVVPVHLHGKEPLVALYHKSCLPLVEKQIESASYKMQILLESLNTNYVDAQHWVEKYPKLFYNLNRPKDLQI